VAIVLMLTRLEGSYIVDNNNVEQLRTVDSFIVLRLLTYTGLS
jgi:hypothetical protein